MSIIYILIFLISLRDWIIEAKTRTGMPKKFDAYHTKIVKWLVVTPIVCFFVSLLFVSDSPKGQESPAIPQDSIAQINKRLKIRN